MKTQIENKLNYIYEHFLTLNNSKLYELFKDTINEETIGYIINDYYNDKDELNILYYIEIIWIRKKWDIVKYIASLLSDKGIKSYKLKESLLYGILGIGQYNNYFDEILREDSAVDFDKRKQIFMEVLNLMKLDKSFFENSFDKHGTLRGYPFNLLFMYYDVVDKNVKLIDIIKNNKNDIADKIVDKWKHKYWYDTDYIIEEPFEFWENNRINFLFNLLIEIGYIKYYILKEWKNEKIESYYNILKRIYKDIIEKYNISKSDIKYKIFNKSMYDDYNSSDDHLSMSLKQLEEKIL